MITTRLSVTVLLTICISIYLTVLDNGSEEIKFSSSSNNINERTVARSTLFSHNKF